MWRFFLLTALSVVLLIGGAAMAGEGDTIQTQIESEMLATQMELAKPGPEHHRLARLEGEWQLTVRLWMEPGAEPMVFEGTGENRMILGGRFLECRSVSGEGPMQTETLTLIGFDRRYERYTSVGWDTWGTYYVTAAGPFNDSTRAIVMAGEDHDPIMGYTQVYDMILRLIDNDTYIWEVVFKNPEITKGAEQFKMVEITSTRVKASQ